MVVTRSQAKKKLTISKSNKTEKNKKKTNHDPDSDREDPNDPDYIPSEEDTETDEDYYESDLEDDDDEEIPAELAEKIKNNIQRRRLYGLKKEDRQKLEIESNKNLTETEKKELIQIQDKINTINLKSMPDRIKILKTPINISTKALILDKIEQFKTMTGHNTEYHKLKKWINGFFRLPLGKYFDIPVKNKSNEEVGNYLCQVKTVLNEAIYGHHKAKNEIVQLVAQWISNPSSKGQVIGLKGPPGTGKTTLVKHGIAKALKRPFCFVPLGGATDSSFLEGHGYTYEGSTWGKIAELLIESQCMNPVIFMDELDKVSETKNGQEINSKLIHLTDFQQNNEFTDKYFTGINFDLSKALFIFSYNDDTKIDPILKDRIKVIEMKGFNEKNKINIAKKYLLPSIYKEFGFKTGDIIFSDEVVKYIIKLTKNEQGVRRLKENLNSIVLKLNVQKYLSYKQTTNMKMNAIKDFKLPFEITPKIVDLLITKNKDNYMIKSLYL